jgi:hypothetical protein
MKIGIAISTYMNENTNKERLNIIKECLDSLKDINELNKIIINDGSKIIEHINLLEEYKNNFKSSQDPLVNLAKEIYSFGESFISEALRKKG